MDLNIKADVNVDDWMEEQRNKQMDGNHTSSYM